MSLPFKGSPAFQPPNLNYAAQTLPLDTPPSLNYRAQGDISANATNSQVQSQINMLTQLLHQS